MKNDQKVNQNDHKQTQRKNNKLETDFSNVVFLCFVFLTPYSPCVYVWISLFIGVFLGLFIFIHGPMYLLGISWIVSA